MVRIASVIAALSILSFTAQAQQKELVLDSFVTQYAKQEKFNGSVLVAEKGKILLQKGYGFKDLARKIKADEKSIYQYGSVTKQFTAALIMYLHEKGKLNIQDKLSKYYPQLSFADSISIYHLLTHTSGIYNYTNDGSFMKSEAVKPATEQKILALFQNKPLEFVPGTRFNYSNSGYMLLGYIIEKVSGKPYEQLMREVILTPAGMKTAGFDFAHAASADKATGYNFINSTQYEAAGVVDSSVSYAAGSLYGSVIDLYAWHNALQKRSFISDSGWKKTYTPLHNKYAYGWSVDSVWNKRVVQHGGGIFGFTSMIKRFPEDDVVIIVLSNTGSNATGEIADNLAAIVFDQKATWPKERKFVTLPVDKLKPLVGEYELRPGFIISISLENENLKLLATGNPKVDLPAESESSFYVQAIDGELSFEKDASGAVTGLKIKQNRGTMSAKKIK